MNFLNFTILFVILIININTANGFIISAIVGLYNSLTCKLFSVNCVKVVEVDTDKPLYITPYLNSKNKDDYLTAQTLAKVNIPEFNKLNISSYSGYLTVDPAFDSNTFFWYFPAQETPDTAPVMLFLNGGPGYTSLPSAFNGNGPVNLDASGQLTANNYSWHQKHHLILIDNPVGTGYSFTGSDAGYANNQTIIGKHLYTAMKQFFQLFPKLKTNEFYINGISYAGKYIPALAYTILQSGDDDDTKINLKGLAIGNGFSDPVNQLVYDRYLYQLGLIDYHGQAQFQKLQSECIACINKEDYVCAFTLFAGIFQTIIDVQPYPIYQNLTGLKSFYDYVQGSPGFKTDAEVTAQQTQYIQFLTSKTTRQGLHVGSNVFVDVTNTTQIVNHLVKDLMMSVADWIKELLSHYRVMIYSGQLDIIVPLTATDNFLNKLNYESAADFKVANRTIWKVGPYVAGYAKTAGKLTQVMMRSAAHFASRSQPEWALDMILRLTSNTGF